MKNRGINHSPKALAPWVWGAVCGIYWLSCTPQLLSSKLPSPEQLLAQSIEYHDPEGVWGSSPLALEVLESRPDGTTRSTVLNVEPSTPVFELQRRDGDRRVEGRIAPEECFWNVVAGDFSQEEIAQLSCATLKRTRDYYLYLWGLPMKLRDPGTRLGSVQRVVLGGRAFLRLRVMYDPAVGADVWDFDFDPETKALVGYRFFHDEAAGDGERIELEGEIEGAGLRLPLNRSWFTNLEDKYLGWDQLATVRRPEILVEEPE